MKILQVSDTFPPAPGGLERAVAALAGGLARRGHESHVATLAAEGMPAEESIVGVQVHRIRGVTHQLARFGGGTHLLHPTAPDPPLVHRLEKLIKTIDPDVIQVHGWILNSVLSTSWPEHTALIVQLHDHGLVCARKTLLHDGRLDEQCEGPSVRRCLPCASKFYGAAKGGMLTLGLRESRRRLDRVDRFVAGSRLVADASAVATGGRCEIIPPFESDAILAPATPWWPEGLARGTEFLLFVGALSEHKGLGLAVAAQRRMRHRLPLVLVGHGDADALHRTMATDRPVIVLPHVPHDQLLGLYAASSAVLAPSRWPEPFGLVAVEAMAAGRPIVVSDVGAQPEVVGDAGIVVGPDATEIADVLDALLDNPHHCALLGERGRRRAVQFTESTVLNRYEDFYREVLWRKLR